MEAWSCMACGGDNPFGMPFCGRCGRRGEVDREMVGNWGCRSCAGTNAETMVFCGRCGLPRGESRPEDLRLVTSLFADISGFTTLADTLDVEDLHAVINPLIGGLAGIAERYDGFIAKYAGDALLCLFGAPTQHEDDAQRAVLAALEMQAALPSLLASLGPAAAGLTIHVGVNTGKVVAGAVGSAAQHDYSVLGDSVILAQRLESVCPPGQTYVGATTAELCRGEFDFEDLGDLTLKGKLSTVRGYRLIGRRRAGTDASRPLVGRDAELATVLSTVQHSGAVVLVGEPGAGKSRLLAEARLQATAGGLRWLPLRCLSYGAGLPYWPFVDLLRQALGLRIEDSVEDMLSRLASSLPPDLVAGAARLLGRPLDELEPEAARRQVHDTLSGMLGVLSSGRPVVLAVEDVHWIDSASADALAELIRTPGNVPLGVVLTTRDEGQERSRELAADAPLAAEVILEPLGAAAVPLVAAGVLAAQVAPGLSELLIARTRGNPLFVEELARSLREDGALVETLAGLDLRPGFDVAALPDTVERVFAARVDSLPLATTSVLLVAAVIGRVIRLSLLEAVAREEGTDLAPLADLVAAGLLDRVVEQDEPAVSFHHALLHDAVYGRLLKKQRRALHRRVADTGRALYGDGDETIDLLARHLYLADAGEEAADALLRAGRRAARLYANDAACEHLQRAYEVLAQLPGHEQDLPALRLQLAELDERRGAYASALQAYGDLVEYAPSPQALRGAMATLRSTGDYAGSLAAFTRGLSRFAARDPAAAPVWLEAGTTLVTMGRVSDAVSTLRTGLRLLGDANVVHQGQLLSQLSQALQLLGDLDAADDAGTQAVALLDRPDSQVQLAKALRIHGYTASLHGDPARAAALLGRAVQAAERTGSLQELGACQLNSGLVALTRGDLPAAEAAYEAALACFERIGHGTGRVQSLGNLAEVALLRDDPDRALALADRAVSSGRQVGHQHAVADALRTGGRAARELGDDQRASRQLLEAARLFEDLEDEEAAAACRDEAMLVTA